MLLYVSNQNYLKFLLILGGWILVPLLMLQKKGINVISVRRKDIIRKIA